MDVQLALIREYCYNDKVLVQSFLKIQASYTYNYLAQFAVMFLHVFYTKSHQNEEFTI